MLEGYTWRYGDKRDHFVLAWAEGSRAEAPRTPSQSTCVLGESQDAPGKGSSKFRKPCKVI